MQGNNNKMIVIKSMKEEMDRNKIKIMVNRRINPIKMEENLKNLKTKSKIIQN